MTTGLHNIQAAVQTKPKKIHMKRINALDIPDPNKGTVTGSTSVKTGVRS